MKRRLVAGGVLLAAVGVGIWFYQEHGIELNPSVLRAQIEELGWLAPLGFMAAAALRFFLSGPDASTVTQYASIWA